MKKGILLLICSLTICLTSCNNTTTGNSGAMLNAIKEEKNISTDIKECEIIVNNGKALIIGVTGESDNTYDYYAAECSIEKEGEYRFERIVSLYNMGWQLRLRKWQNGYVIFCNNKEAKKLEIVINGVECGEQTKIEKIENIPWVYYLEDVPINSDYNIEWTFQDSKGNEVY